MKPIRFFSIQIFRGFSGFQVFLRFFKKNGFFRFWIFKFRNIETDRIFLSFIPYSVQVFLDHIWIRIRVSGKSLKPILNGKQKPFFPKIKFEWTKIPN